MNMNKTTNTKKKVAIYVRVASDNQEETCGIEAQEKRLRDFVIQNDYSLDERHVYKDRCVSGFLPLEKRPEAKKLFEGARKHEFDTVIVYRIDRLFRKAKLLLEAMDEFDRLKIDIQSVTDHINTNSSEGRFMMTIFSSMAEMERNIIQERIMRGKMAIKNKLMTT